MFSVGVLYSSQEFISFINTTPTLTLQFPPTFKYFSNVSLISILEVCQKCEWMCLNTSGYLEVTERGREILLADDPIKSLRIQIGHLIETYIPPWLPLLSRGRLETIQYLPPNVFQCFSEAKLFDEITTEIVGWWDKYSKVSRKIGKDLKLETGRQGEILSIQYERKRTEKEPIWQGFESNLSGYDILSVVEKFNNRPLKIEVKTTNSSVHGGLFHISRNEWSVALLSENYLFHLWALLPKPTLFIIPVESIKIHVPEDHGDGIWENAEIPFSAVI